MGLSQLVRLWSQSRRTSAATTVHMQLLCISAWETLYNTELMSKLGCRQFRYDTREDGGGLDICQQNAADVYSKSGHALVSRWKMTEVTIATDVEEIRGVRN